MIKSLTLVAACSLVGVSSAATYRWTWDGTTGPVSHAGGRINAANAYYAQDTEYFGVNINFGNVPGSTKQPSGFWLAVSDGPNPKGFAGELALFYFDASKSSPVLTAYGYNGQNGSTSYYDGSPASGTQAPDRIASSLTTSDFIRAIQVKTEANGSKTMSFDIKGSIINSFNPANGGETAWKGVEFGSKFGIWMHPVTDLNTTYNQAGFLTSWQHGASGYLDLDRQNAECVPEPASLTALALGGLAFLRKRKS